jgi:hypothetical protein
MTSLPPLSTTPLPPPPGSSDPLNSFLSTTCMDLLLIEVVAQAKRLASQPLPLADILFLDTNAPVPTEVDDDAEKENMYYRLEPMGFRVGQGIAERLPCQSKADEDSAVIDRGSRIRWTLSSFSVRIYGQSSFENK